MKKIQIISFRIIALFTVAIFVSFIPEYLHDFFGDWICKGRGYVAPIENGFTGGYLGCDYVNDYVPHNPTNHWGYRHWLFYTMGLVLFIIQLVDIIRFADKEIK